MSNASRIPFRIALSVISIVLITMTSLGIGVYAFVSTQSIIDDLADDLIDELFTKVFVLANARLESASHILELNRSALTSGAIDPTSTTALGEHFVQVLDAYPHITVSGYGDRNGVAIWSYRTETGAIVLDAYAVQPDGRTLFREYQLEGDGRWILDKEDPNATYDPRQRPWYQVAKPQDEAAWTEPYIFLPQEVPGVTRAGRILDDAGVLGVTTIDFDLDFLSEMLRRGELGQRGTIFITTPEGAVIAHTHPDALVSRDAQGKAQVAHITDNPDPVSKRALGLLENERKARFDFEGLSYIAVQRPITVASGLEWTITLIVPEEVVLGDVQRRRQIILAICIASLLLAMIASFFFARRISGGIHRLTDEMEQISQLDIAPRHDWSSRLKEIDILRESIENMKRGLRSFEKFVPAELVRQLIASGQEAELSGERRTLTVLFTDLEAFTSFTEKHSAEELIETLSEYLTQASEIIQSHGGTIDKFIGDAVMAFWNAPMADPEHATHAARAALELQASLSTFLEERQMRLRIGIHSGECVVGNMGSPKRLNYTAVGDAVNVAARLESANKIYGTSILISEQTRAAIGDAFDIQHIDRAEIRGRQEPLDVYSLNGEHP